MVPTRYWKHPGTAAGSPGVYRAGLRGWVVTDVPRYPGYKTLTNVIKYDDKTNPSVWLVDYHLACKAGGVDDDLFIIQFLPIYLADSAQAWLDHLPRNIIDSWENLYEIFTGNFQGTYTRRVNPWDLKSLRQKSGVSL
jgi:hypothetical protein